VLTEIFVLASGFKAGKIYSLSGEDPWVEVLVSGYEGIAAADAYAFKRAKIDGIRALGSEHSVMTLNDKTEIILTLPQAVLLQRLNAPEGAVIDLKDKTLVTGRDTLIKSLRAEAKRRAELEKEKEITSLNIKAFVRASQKSEFVPFTFAGADLQLDAMEEGGSIHGGKNLRLKLCDGETPFGDKNFIIETKLDEFRALCREAYQKGADFVDISDYSMRKFRDMTPQQRRKLHEQENRP